MRPGGATHSALGPAGAALLLVAALGLAGCSSDDPNSAIGTPAPSASSSATSSTGSAVTDDGHTNNLYLQPANMPIDVSFTWAQGSYSITADQQSTWKGVTNCSATAGNICQVVVDAGRKASSEPAQWFAGRAPVALVTNGWSATKPEPDELNFAISGTLTINGTSYPVAMGQGSYVMESIDNNNWWIGGEGWIDFGTAILTPDRQYWVTGSNNNAVFALGKGLPPESEPSLPAPTP